MAAISSVSNGEAMSSVRTKLNSVITEVNLLDPTDWVDYTNSATIVGWSASGFTKSLKYRVVGKQVFVLYYLAGTSNSATTTFTLPYTPINDQLLLTYSANGGSFASNSFILFSSGSATVTCYQNNSATWTASNVKQVIGQVFYQTA